MDGEETFLFLSNRRDREPIPELWREESGANHYPIGAPALQKSRDSVPMAVLLYTLPPYASLDSGVYEYLVGSLCEVDMTHDSTDLVTRGGGGDCKVSRLADIQT